MRLGQLARNLRVSQKDITDFLTAQSITISEGSNAKIEPEIEVIIKAKFQPEILEEENPVNPDPIPQNEESEEVQDEAETIISEEVTGLTEESDDHSPNPENDITLADIEDSIETIPSIETNNSDDKTEDIIELVTETKEQTFATAEPEEIDNHSAQPFLTVDDLIDQANAEGTSLEENDSEEPNGEVQVIRVKKVKLDGIKVVGKIDLPEPKVKDETENEDASDSNNEKKSERKPRYQKDKRYKGKGHPRQKRRETYEQRVEREKREAESKKKKAEREQKARKKQHYMENVQAHVQIKPTKKAKKKEKLAQKQIEIIEKPNNPVKRFWGWLNGKYDNY